MQGCGVDFVPGLAEKTATTGANRGASNESNALLENHGILHTLGGGHHTAHGEYDVVGMIYREFLDDP